MDLRYLQIQLFSKMKIAEFVNSVHVGLGPTLFTIQLFSKMKIADFVNSVHVGLGPTLFTNSAIFIFEL